MTHPLKQSGFTPESVAKAVAAEDLTLLKHSGVLNVTLDPPTTKTVDPEEDPTTAVAIAYVHQDQVSYSWYHSMTQMLAYDASNQARIWRGGYVAMRGGTDGLAEARNTAIREFLADSAASWIFWVDTDMGFAADTLDRLFEAADPVERPIVGGLCFANREREKDDMGGWRTVAAPMILDWVHDGEEKGFDVRWDYPQNTVVQCSGTGSACVLVHRSVYERILAQYGQQWYSRARNPSTGQLIGEDLSFCVRVMALDIPVHVHTGVTTTHHKSMWLSAEDYWRQRAINPPPPKVNEVLPETTPEWTVPRFAVIPTHNRPTKLLSLVASLGPQCDIIVILDNASEPPVNVDKLRLAVSSRVVIDVIQDDEQPPNLSRFWNVLLDRCDELAERDVYDVAVFNDDSVLPAGWYDCVATAMREHKTAQVAFTDTFGLLPSMTLLTDLDNDKYRRMCPWAFVMRGEDGLRSDETMRWWFFDTDLDWRARQTGGVLSVPGPKVGNAHANSSTVGPLAVQAEQDRKTFEAKWDQP